MSVCLFVTLSLTQTHTHSLSLCFLCNMKSLHYFTLHAKEMYLRHVSAVCVYFCPSGILCLSLSVSLSLYLSIYLSLSVSLCLSLSRVRALSLSHTLSLSLSLCFLCNMKSLHHFNLHAKEIDIEAGTISIAQDILLTS